MLLEPVHAVRSLRIHAHSIRGGASRFAGGIGSALATALCLVALLAAVAVVQTRTPPPALPRIERQSLEWLREAYATRRLRNAVDAYRLAEGHWPATLERVARRGYLDEEALAAPEGRPYYSANRDDGVVLLAPEY